TVYEPTVTGLPPIGPYIRSIWERRQFVWNLARTDLKAEHYDSFIGQAWILLDPLLQAAVYYLLRIVVRPVSGANRQALIAHLIWAVFFFTFTAKCMQTGAKSVVGGKQLILNASFPRAILPLVAIIEGTLDFLPTVGIYLIFQALLGQPFGLGLAFLPLLIALQAIFNLGLALLFSPLTVFFRDTAGFIPYMVRIWMYTTPVLYFVREVPPNLRFLRFNPLYPLFAALEQIFAGAMPSKTYIVQF